MWLVKQTRETDEIIRASRLRIQTISLRLYYFEWFHYALYHITYMSETASVFIVEQLIVT